MNSRLSPEQASLHERARKLSWRHRKIEWLLIETLQKIDGQKIYKLLGHRSLFQYGVESLGLSEAVAYAFVSVARKALVVDSLKEGLQSQTLSVSKASRIVSVLTPENADSLVAFAKTHTSREIDLEVASFRPQNERQERVKPLSAEMMEIKVSVSRKVYEKIKRAQDVAAQKQKNHPDLGKTLEIMADEFLKHQDPVVKAERILAKRKRNQDQRENIQRTQLQKDQDQDQDQDQFQLQRDQFQQGQDPSVLPKVHSKPCHETGNPKLCLGKIGPALEEKSKGEVTPKTERIRFTALEKHQVFARDSGRCTFVDSRGERCSERRWLHLHHIRAVSFGGGNEMENITTLCSFHHDLSHQLSLPLEAQVTWL